MKVDAGHMGDSVSGTGPDQTTPAVQRWGPPSMAIGQIITSRLEAEAVSVAAELGIADLLADGPRAVGELARTTGTDPSSLRRVLRFLASLDVFSEEEHDRFALTPLADGLRSDVPGSFRALARFFGGPVGGRAIAGLLDSVRTGETVISRVYGMSMWEYLAEHPDQAAIFNDHMTTQTERQIPAILAAYDFSGIGTLVDVGGGHGVLLSAILREYPGMRGIVYDQPNVVAGASPVLAATGMADRITAVGGDMLTTAPEGGDAYMMKTVLHNWRDEPAIAILSNVHAVLKPGGKLLLLEHVIQAGAQYGKLLDLMMLTLLGSRERTLAEWEDLLSAARFQVVRIVPTGAGLRVIEANRA